MTTIDRLLIAFGVTFVLGVGCAQVYMRAETATQRAELALSQHHYLDATAFAQEGSRSWCPFTSHRSRAEVVLAQVSKHAEEAHDDALKTIAERAREAARIETEWFSTAGPRDRVHGRPAWLNVLLIAFAPVAMLASLRLGKRWPIAIVVGLGCCAVGYLVP